MAGHSAMEGGRWREDLPGAAGGRGRGGVPLGDVERLPDLGNLGAWGTVVSSWGPLI